MTRIILLLLLCGAALASPAPAAESTPTPPSIERVAGGLKLNGLNCALLPAKSTDRLPNLGAVVRTNGRLASVGGVATLNPFGAVTVGGGDSGLPPGTWQHTGIDIPSNGKTMDIHAADNGVVVFSSLDVNIPSDLKCPPRTQTDPPRPALCTFLDRGGLVVIKHLVAGGDGDVLTVPAYKCPGKESAGTCHDELSTGEMIYVLPAPASRDDYGTHGRSGPGRATDRPRLHGHREEATRIRVPTPPPS